MIDLGNYKDYFSEKVGEILNQAVEESKKRQHGNLGVEHLFIQLILQRIRMKGTLKLLKIDE